MLYELLNGKKPFEGERNLDILTNIIGKQSEIDYQSSIASAEFKSIISFVAWQLCIFIKTAEQLNIIKIIFLIFYPKTMIYFDSF